MNLHENLLKHQCLVCEKYFRHKYYLNVHIKTVHENLKEHQCLACYKSFAQKFDLKCHLETVHKNIKRHVCQVCNRPFGKKSALNGHIKTVHQNIKEHKFPRTRIRNVVEIMRLFFVCMAGDLKFYHVLFFKLIVLARMICNPEYKL